MSTWLGGETERRTGTQLSSKLGNGDLSPFEFPNEHVLESTAPDLLQFLQLVWRYLSVFEPKSSEIQFELRLTNGFIVLTVCSGERRGSRLVYVYSL